MVKICNNNYSTENDDNYREHFEKFSFPLSDFQKHSIEGIVEGHHSLVCCPTGSGKTLPAEFAIDYFVSQGKRVIYTSPLKALSNEKYYDFTRKYPHITFGVLTGDIKVNPDAQVLIMTAEILLNTLFGKKNTTIDSTSGKLSLSFEMDFDTELACVIMDEIHFINDAARGNVWEQTLMILPHHIQLIMLSATLDSPEKFAKWIEDRDSSKQKDVYLSTANNRIVPLTHYSFITTNQGFFKQIKKDEALTKEVKDMINHPIMIQSAKSEFQEANYHKIKRTLNLFRQKDVYIKRQHIINEICKYMFDNNMLPAVLFILSRKQIESVSKEITTNLLEDDSKIPYIVHKECEDILRKLPNYEEYLQLPDYIQMVSLLQKGIGMHHSGIIPILREITEILFAKGYIKLLLATETFSVGLNMPIKTTVFTSLSKYDGIENRYFHSHEYMQCSGRAGRRGIDKIGTVIHLNNLFRQPIELQDYRLIMNGKPQTLLSKFKISYNLLMNLIIKDGSVESCMDFLNQSMINTTIQSELNCIKKKIDETENNLIKIEEVMSCLKTPKNILEDYITFNESRTTAVNKKRKELDRKIQNIQDEYKTIDQDKQQYWLYKERSKCLVDLNQEYENTDKYLYKNLNTVLNFLETENFIKSNENNKLEVTLSGFISAQLKEVNCLTFSKLIFENRMNELSAKEMVELFCCFTNIMVDDDNKNLNYKNNKNKIVVKILDDINTDYEKYQDFETENRIETGVEYIIHYDLMDYISEWYDSKSVDECKILLQKIEKEKGIFLGEFIKAILKINTISSEMETIAESIGNMELLSRLKEIPINTMKFVATNQSLYL